MSKFIDSKVQPINKVAEIFGAQLVEGAGGTSNSIRSEALDDILEEYFNTRNYMIWPAISHNIKEYEGRSIPECKAWIVKLLTDLGFIDG